MWEIMRRIRELKMALRMLDLVKETNRIAKLINGNKEQIYQSKMECKRFEGEYVGQLIKIGAKELLDMVEPRYMNDDQASELMMKWLAEIKNLEVLELKLQRLQQIHNLNSMQLVGRMVKW